jgi:Viral BACON domain
MSPHKPQTRRFNPFILPLLMVFMLCAWMILGRDSSNHSEARSVPPRSISSETHKSASLAGERAELNRLIQTQERATEPPRDPEVIALFDKFRESERTVTQSVMTKLASTQVGKRASFSAAGMDFAGVVDSRKDSAGVILLGMKLDNELGRFQMSLRPDSRILASIFFNGETHAFSIKGFPKDGAWQVEKATVAELLCAPAGATYPIGGDKSWVGRAGKAAGAGKAERAGPPIATGGGGAGVGVAPKNGFKVPDLESMPDSTYVLYIDFDGEVVTNPAWNDGATINAQPSSFADDEAAITIIWQRVSEDYMPFDLNVTTNRAVYDATPAARRQMCVMTTTQFFPFDLAGVANISSFGQEINCWGFDDFLIGNDAYHGETISHEVGHTMSLLHDGNAAQEYYPGHGAGLTSWAPIMGDFSQDVFQPEVNDELTTWSKGEYTGANNQQDDLNLITSQFGFGFKDDDKPNTREEAVPLGVEESVIEDLGLIERNTDEDWFVFPTSGGPATITARGLNVNSSAAPQRGSNLAIGLELYDSSGTMVASANPADEINATISQSLDPGNYYLRVEGVGKGSPADGFSEYGSLGQYFLSGRAPQEGLPVITPPETVLGMGGGSGQFLVSAQGTWEWSTDSTWITSSEAKSQTGNQTFDFRVASNPAGGTRTGKISITLNGVSVDHTVTQTPVDDHGNTIETATPIAQNSDEPGFLEEELDRDVFQIDVKGFGTLTVYGTGTTDTFGELLDFEGTRIAANDRGRDPNFRIVSQVSTGRYFVRVRSGLPDGGTGGYTVVSRFKPGSALMINPTQRTVGAKGGDFSFDVTSNTSWEWSTKATWIKSSLPKTATRGQFFEYQVLPNKSVTKRSAIITLKSGNQTVNHKVIQNGTTADDHGDTRSQATPLPRNGSLAGNIESQADLDVFKIVLDTSGTLLLRTTGSFDSYGILSDATGGEIASNDDFDDSNFRISRAVGAGTYYVTVRHFSYEGQGAYRLYSSFTPSALVNMIYDESEGGAVRGPKRQTVPLGGSGQEVIAVPKRGYSFSKWSDGKKSPIRKDVNLKTHVVAVAEFVPTFAVRPMGGAYLVDNQLPPVDYGIVGRDTSKAFVIKNSGGTPLTNLRFTMSGLNPSAWKVNSLAKTTLKPGESVNLVATLTNESVGAKSATLTLSAVGVQGPFRIRLMGSVVAVQGGGVIIPPPPPPVTIRPNSRPANSLAGSGGIAQDKLEEIVPVSKDGLVRHVYRRPVGDKELPVFWISTNGTSWTKASLLKVIRLSRGAKSDEYLAVFSPPTPRASVVLISEKPPKIVNP